MTASVLRERFAFPEQQEGKQRFHEDHDGGEGGPATLDGQVAAFERRVLVEALRRNGGNRSAAGRELGVSPRMMTYRLKKAGISQ